jgi:hypothetical protein
VGLDLDRARRQAKELLRAARSGDARLCLDHSAGRFSVEVGCETTPYATFHSQHPLSDRSARL